MSQKTGPPSRQNTTVSQKKAKPAVEKPKSTKPSPKLDRKSTKPSPVLDRKAKATKPSPKLDRKKKAAVSVAKRDEDAANKLDDIKEGEGTEFAGLQNSFFVREGVFDPSRPKKNPKTDCPVC